MENFLPALLIIGGIIYKIYTEYQKEQEKARRRMPQVPPPTPPVTYEQQPKPIVIEPTTFIPIPTKKAERLRDIPKEVKKTTDGRLAEANRKKAAMKVVPEIEEEDDIVPFDLRQAVIQSAILNRPYQ